MTVSSRNWACAYFRPRPDAPQEVVARPRKNKRCTRQYRAARGRSRTGNIRATRGLVSCIAREARSVMAEDEGPLGTVDVAVTSVYAADLDAAIRWYEAALGLKPVSVGDDVHPHAAFQLGASLIVLEPISEAWEPAV